MKKKEIIIVSAFIGFVVIMLGAYQLYTSTLNKTVVKVVHKDEVLFTFDPNVDYIYAFEGSYGHMEVEVKDGRWRVINEECPNHICSSIGWVDADSYMPIVCIPNEVYIAVAD